ncbi:MAG: ABC transporter permease [Anaerolineaceae bacterium]|nr:MAG: ABC transporter permease [Anaerolineaceae bacterium]
MSQAPDSIEKNTTQYTPPQDDTPDSILDFFKRLFQMREMGVLLALILLVLFVNSQSEFFWTSRNIFNILRSMSTIGIIAIGMTMIIITAGIDLSVGSMMAAAAMMTARLMYTDVLPPLPAVIVGFGFGAMLGFINGFIITKIKVNPFITTLGMLSIARGLTLLLATGIQGTVASNIPMRNPHINFLGAGYVGDIPMPVIIMFSLVIIFSLFLRYTVLGRQIYAVGSNEEAARLSGVSVDRVKIFAYTLTGVLCALAGVMQAGLLSTASTSAGQMLELDVIAAVVIGGASLMGGQGSIFGAVIGAAIMAVLRNAFVLLQFPSYAQTITIGVVIILAVSIDQIRRSERTIFTDIRDRFAGKSG